MVVGRGKTAIHRTLIQSKSPISTVVLLYSFLSQRYLKHVILRFFCSSNEEVDANVNGFETKNLDL